jgi:hypothetical protein
MIIATVNCGDETFFLRMLLSPKTEKFGIFKEKES